MIVFFVFVFFGFVLVFLIVFSEVDFLEKVEERVDFFLDGFLFVFIFPLDDLDGDVLTLLPVDFITEASLNLITFDLEFLRQGGIGEPFIFGKGEDDLKAVFAFFGGLNSGQVFE